jgi:hypothetical protein
VSPRRKEISKGDGSRLHQSPKEIVNNYEIYQENCCAEGKSNGESGTRSSDLSRLERLIPNDSGSRHIVRERIMIDSNRHEKTLTEP